MAENSKIELTHNTFNQLVTNWRMPEKLNRKTEIEFSAWERFQADNGLSDDEMIEGHGFIKPRRPRVLTEWRIDLINLILSTPYLDWLLLTKRIGNAEKMLEGIDLVIVGGESWPGARPMQTEWARSLREQCQSAGVEFMCV